MSDPRLHTGRRALGREHFAFYRAAMEGLHLEAVWDRFLTLEGDYSPAMATATIQWIRLELIELAKSTDKALVGVLRRDPRKLKGMKLPSMDEFAEALDDPDFYSQAELQALWTEAYGHRVDKSADRKANLVERLRRAIAALEAAYASRPFNLPALGDYTRHWFTDRLSASLAAVGIVTLQGLVERRLRLGDKWWRDIPRLGETGATRLGGWVDSHFPTAPSPAIAPLAPANGILPRTVATAQAAMAVPAGDRQQGGQPEGQFEELSLSATFPSHRESPSPDERLIEATNDEAAVQAFLDAKCSNANTRRSYAREAERVVLWCQRERSKGFSDLTVEDCSAYSRWLQCLNRMPPEEWEEAGWRVPQAAWTGVKGAPRSSSAWRPFVGPLDERSRAHALVITTSMFRFLAISGYLGHVSPWELLGRTARRADNSFNSEEALDDVDIEPDDEVKASKSFDVEQRSFLLHRAGQLQGALGKRTALVLYLGFACGFRGAEMANLKLGNIRPDHGGWAIVLRGKGRKIRSIPFPRPVVTAAFAYLLECKVETQLALRLIHERSREPLLRSHSRREGKADHRTSAPRVGYQGLRQSLELFFNECATLLELDQPAAARRFRSASLHWMRHTFATLMLESGTSINVVQEILGHADVGTTGGYTIPKRKLKQKASEDFAKSMFKDDAS